MGSKNINLITIGYAKQALMPGSRESVRMMAYAEKLKSLHVVVFTKKKDGFTTSVHQGNLTVHPTNSICRPLMIVDAFLIGWRIISTLKGEHVRISSQDPFETSLVGRPLAWVKHIPHHVQLHGDNFSSDSWRAESCLNRLRYWFGLRIMRSAPRIRVASERIKTSLVTHGVIESRITVLPIRPELERFLATERISRTNTPLVFLTVSRLAPEKNIPLMLRAFKTFLETHPGHKLRIMGSGSKEENLRRLIHTQALEYAVTFIPWSNDVPRVMADADVFLLASDHEAYGLVLVEALASGLPVITTNVGCVGEVVQGGVHGIVVPPKDEAGYVHALSKIAEDTQFREGCEKAGRVTAKEIAQLTEEAYTDAWVAAHVVS